MTPETSDSPPPAGSGPARGRARRLTGWSLLGLSLGGLFLFSYLRTADIDGLLATLRGRLAKIETDAGPGKLDQLVARHLEGERSRLRSTYARKFSVAELEQRVGEAADRSEQLGGEVEKIRAEVRHALTANEAMAGDFDRVRKQLTALDGRLVALAEDLAGFEVPRIDTGELIESAAREALDRMKQQTVSLSQRIETTRAAIDEVRAALPDASLLREEITAHVIALMREASLTNAREMMRSANDLTRALGVHRLIDLEAATVEAEIRPYLGELDPDSYPLTTQAILTLLADHRAASVRALLTEATLGRINPRLVPYGMAFLAGLDYADRHARLAPAVLAVTLHAVHINNPERFFAVIDILESLDAAGALQPTLSSAPQGTADALGRFFENYTASRVLGYDPDRAVFPVEDPAQLLASGHPSPRLGQASRERALALARLMRRSGLAKRAGRYTLALRRYSSPGSDATLLLRELLRQLSGQDLGTDWSAWAAWAGSS